MASRKVAASEKVQKLLGEGTIIISVCPAAGSEGTPIVCVSEPGHMKYLAG